MAEFKVSFDANSFTTTIQRVSKKVQDSAKVALEDCVYELIRIASEITPFEKGILQKSHSEKVKVNRSGYEGIVTFSVKEGDFNYALWTHEGIYNYGEGTLRRKGTVGWSGKYYYAGRKYVERPLKGEQEAFYKHIAKEIRKVLGG